MTVHTLIIILKGPVLQSEFSQCQRMQNEMHVINDASLSQFKPGGSKTIALFLFKRNEKLNDTVRERVFAQKALVWTIEKNLISLDIEKVCSYAAAVNFVCTLQGGATTAVRVENWAKCGVLRPSRASE